MDNIAIQTSQNIAIEQSVASVGERIVAAIIDYTFIFFYVIIIQVINSAFLNSEAVNIVLSALPVLFYHFISELAMEGQSWGKKIMKIKVIKIDGSQPDFTSYLIRWVFRLVDVLIFFGGISAIVIILNGKGQRLGDIAAHTTVIRLKDEQLNDTIYTRLPENYNLGFPQVNKLSDSDIYTAKEVLEFMSDSYNSIDSLEMAEKAKLAFESKMGIKSDKDAGTFLQSVILDYNYIHSR